MTLFNIITRFLKPSSGELKFKDENIAGLSRHRLNCLGIGYTFQDLQPALQMTALKKILLAQEQKRFIFATLVYELRNSDKAALQIEHHSDYIQKTRDRVQWLEEGELQEAIC